MSFFRALVAALKALATFLDDFDSTHKKGAIQMETPDISRQLDMYKTAYEIAAGRYENLYKSVWTNFSYMTAIAAAFVTFGATRFYGQVVTMIGCAPLIFWYRATYLPLDDYGEQALENVVALEKQINDRFGLQVDHFTKFREFKRSPGRQRKRVNFTVTAGMRVIYILFAIAFVWAAFKVYRGEHLLKGPESSALTISIPSDIRELQHPIDVRIQA